MTIRTTQFLNICTHFNS